jgi:hypothetical protein
MKMMLMNDIALAMHVSRHHFEVKVVHWLTHQIRMSVVVKNSLGGSLLVLMRTRNSVLYKGVLTRYIILPSSVAAPTGRPTPSPTGPLQHLHHQQRVQHQVAPASQGKGQHEARTPLGLQVEAKMHKLMDEKHVKHVRGSKVP